MINRMLNTNDIRYLLLEELKNNNVKDAGYDCFNGRQYVELRNVIFHVDKDKIFDEVPPLERMTPQWYEENYDPILNKNNQFEKCIKKLRENPATRQAVIIMGDINEFDYPVFICTMYMHIFLDSNDDGTYNLEYTVHMRSNDAIEFDTDVQWHRKIINRIIEKIKDKYYIKDVNMFWNADTIHLYSHFWNEIQTK